MKNPPRVLRYLGAIVSATLAQAAHWPFHAAPAATDITYLPFVLLAGAFGGLGPALVGAALCTAESIFYGGSVASAGALAVSGVAAGLFMDRLKQFSERERTSRLELAAVQHSAPVMLMMVDENLRVRKANDLAGQFSGWNVPALIGLRPGGVIGCLNARENPSGCGYGAPCSQCAIRRTIADTLQHGTAHRGEEAWVRVMIDGREQQRCLELSSAILGRQRDGKTALVCAQDITERKRAEMELRAQRDALQRQAALIDLSHDAIVVADADRGIIGWNTGAAEVYGWTEAEAMGQSTDRFLETQAGTTTEAVDQILHEAGRWEGELEQSRRDGARVTVESRQVLLRDEAGNAAGFLEINRDITERKLARDRLMEAHRRHTTVLESISDGFNAFDRDWRFTYVNAAALAMVGLSREELLGRDVWETWPHLADSPFGAAYRRAMAENVCVKIEAFYPEPLEKWFEARCYPSPDGLSVFFSDVTQRRQSEDEIRRLNADLERRVQERTAQLERANQELEAFAYSVSHDLRAPLRGIDGWSVTLLEDFGDQLSADARHCLARVQSEAQRMSQLIDDMLRLSRVTLAPLERGSVDLTELARSIADNLREAQPERSIEFEVQTGLTVSGDAQLLEIVLNNLFCNAAKFTAKREAARIEFGVTRNGGAPTFHVRDNGAGFDMANSGSLFGPFQRLHRVSDFPGTGIGLATVQRIIHRHGGRVWADAQVDRGATFYFTLG